MKKNKLLLLSTLFVLLLSSCGPTSQGESSTTTSNQTTTTTTITTTTTNTTLTIPPGPIENYDEYADSYSEANHLYIHYLRPGATIEDYNQYGLWMWPIAKDGVLFANSLPSTISNLGGAGWVDSIGDSGEPVDQAGAMIDIDLTKIYKSGKAGTNISYADVNRIGYLIVQLDSMGGGTHWTSDGGADSFLEDVQTSFRDNGSIHVFLVQGSVTSPRYYYNEEVYENPIANDTTGKYRSESNLDSSSSSYPNPITSQKFKTSAKVGYQIFVPSFCDSNNDGYGDLRGIINKLDYLKELNVDTLWLSPFLKCNSYHGYDTVDYYEVDEKFGTMDDFKELIYKAHQKGIKVLMDLVINHTSTSSVWFKKAQRGEKGVDKFGNEFNYRDLFHFKFKGDVVNGVKVEESSDWYQDGESNYYYFAKFASDMAELNYDNQVTRNFVIDMALHYLGMGVDGFRLDAVKHIYMKDEVDPKASDEIEEDTGTRTYFDEEMNDFVTTEYDYSTNKTKNINFWKEFSIKLKAQYPDCFLTAENLDGWDQRVAPYYQSLDSQLDFCNYYDLANNLFAGISGMGANTLVDKVNNKDDIFRSYRSDYINASFTSNHDLLRAINHVNAKKTSETGVEENIKITGNTTQLNKAKLYAALTILQPGVSFIYYGDELGMSSNTTEDVPDIAGNTNNIDRYYRQAFKWANVDERPNYSFAGGYDIKYDEYNMQLDNLDLQKEDQDSMFNFYKAICEIKGSSDFPSNGDMVAYKYDAALQNCYHYVINPSESYQKTYKVWVNIGNSSVDYDIGDAEVVFKYNASDTSLNQYGLVVVKE